MADVAIVGTGYVGLTTGAFLAHAGHRVTCADVDAAKIDLLNAGEIPIVEPGLLELVREGVDGGRLRFTVGAAAAAAEADFVFLCVQTPQGSDGAADLSYIESAATEISTSLRSQSVVINKSTVPVGSTLVVERALGRSDVSVVSNPEFLREGSAVHDCFHPDRIVIGSEDHAAAIRVSELYESVKAPLLITDPASAETIKYASNAFLATKISFVNAIANVCEAVGADVREVVLGMGYDKRIGFEFLRPGPGWGGSCFPKDTRALVRIAEDAGYDFDLLRSAMEVNEQQFERVADKVRSLVGGDLTGAKVAIWGLTFKARTDDVRRSPSLEVIERLQAKGAKVKAYDPAAKETPKDVERAGDPYAACEGADVLVVLTEWDELRWVDFEKVAGVMNEAKIVDCRNLIDPAAVRRKGFAYEGLGRP